MCDEEIIYREIATIKNFQPAMTLPENAFSAKSACPSDLVSNGTPWEDLGFPADGTDILIPENTEVIISSTSLIRYSLELFPGMGTNPLKILT